VPSNAKISKISSVEPDIIMLIWSDI